MGKDLEKRLMKEIVLILTKIIVEEFNLGDS